MLSKSRYVRGIKCQKSLWLYKHKKEEQLVSESAMAVFSRGTNVGELAQNYFPDGKMAVLEDYPGYASAQRTQEFIMQGVETIYEATFIYDSTLVAVDILHKEGGKWFMYEVKSTNSTKPEHIIDVAVQYYVVSGSGLPLADAFLMHFNRDYVRRGDINVKELFVADSVYSDILSNQEEVRLKIPELLKVLEGDEPVIEMGAHCSNPYDCDFCDYCASLLPPKDVEIIELSNIPEVKENEVKAFVNAIEYPICHLDFETIMPGVPLFDESRPYQQVPFQYSLHLQESPDSEIQHFQYLAPSDLTIDPRKGLIEQMINETKGGKTIFVYHIPFERTRIYEMMRDFPQYTEPLQSIIDRMVDLIIPFKRKYYRTETMKGSSSIKKVLPALYPELSYDDLAISEGMAASNAFLDLYYCNDENVTKQTREDLLKYCHLDTLAMVKILEVLKGV
ncbi:MAG: DUF2779 domain-containing protein [Bacteroidales bacterium]|nr:DUF2779 domain-containing protein [Bacteroidales bacterium]